jgi:RNA polymerase sigma factor (sigma-70 family)
VTEALQRQPDGSSDAVLIAAVRRGDLSAYGVLYERHLAAAKRAATYLANTGAEREDLIAEAFTRVLQMLRSGRGPTEELRPYLLVTMRHAAINAARKRSVTALYAEVPEFVSPMADPVDTRLDGNEAASAFAELPPRWRQVLWHTEVEGASPATLAPMLGMTPNGVAALAYRAREGLRQAYLRAQLPADVGSGECRATTDKLAGWVRRSISPSQRRKLAAHLARCARCRELEAGLSEVNSELGAMGNPLVSWLSAIKGMVTLKVGAAAAIAAVTVVTVVGSEPPVAHERQAPTIAEPAATVPGTNRKGTELRVSPAAERPPAHGAQEPAAGPSPEQRPGEETPARPDSETAAAAKEAAQAKRAQRTSERPEVNPGRKAEKANPRSAENPPAG